MGTGSARTFSNFALSLRGDFGALCAAMTSLAQRSPVEKFISVETSRSNRTRMALAASERAASRAHN